MKDTFNGDNLKLIASIEALLSLDAAGALVPHGVGGHARALLESAANRLAATPAGAVPEPIPAKYRGHVELGGPDRPTYYVRHPDDSYSVAEPQPLPLSGGVQGDAAREPICSESGYLCYAYGESDFPVARLCHTRDEVLQFMLREWFGDENPEAMHPDNRENWDSAVAEFDAPEWDLGNELVWELEQGGVTITKVNFYAPVAISSQQDGGRGG